MIISGASRSGGAWFARHLTNADHNERVTLIEITGLPGADDIAGAFRAMEAIADNRGTRTRNYFYHLNINPEADENLTPEQWTHTVSTSERNLRFVGQPRIVVEHQKHGRTHRHVIWSRIDIEKSTAISDSKNYAKHDATSRELEAAFGLKATASAFGPDRQRRHDKDRPSSRELFRGMESGIDVRELTKHVTELWRAADSGKSFAAALEAEGFIFAKGDRKEGTILIIDQAGHEHSLVRRLKGVTTEAMRARMAEIDRDAMPDAATARAAQRERMRTEPWQAAGPEKVPPQPEIRAEIRAVERAATGPAPKPARAAQKALARRTRRGGTMRYAPLQTGTAWRFPNPSWPPATEREAKDPSLIPTRQPASSRAHEEPGLPDCTGTGPRHRAVNTLAPTPGLIPDEPEARAAYFREQQGIPHPEDLKLAQERLKAGRKQEARLRAAPSRSGRSGRSGSGRSRWFHDFRKAQGIVRKITGRDIDTRHMTEAQRTRLAAERGAGRMATWADPRPPRIAALMDRRRRFREMARGCIGRHIDTRDLSEAERTESSRELTRQLLEGDREAIREHLARGREALRVERWKLKKLKPRCRQLTPD